MVRSFIYWLNFLLVGVAVISVLKSRKTPTSTLAWILSLVFIPGLGLVSYILLGIDWKKRRLVTMVPEEVFSTFLADSLSKQDSLIKTMIEASETRYRRMARSIRLIMRAASAPVTGGNEATAFFTGKDKFDSLISDLESARDSIHMEYYIWRSDELGRRILEVLKRKADEGVMIRLIFDGWGSFGTVSFAYRRALKAAGIEYAYFLDLTNPLARLKINYRNHRKIAVIDGRTAYTGGMNVGQEYITGGRKFPKWRDTHLRLEGPVVAMLQAIFLVDWQNSGHELLIRESMFPAIRPETIDTGIPVQIASSGPDSKWEGIRLHFLELLNGARDEVLIQTPYFIPGEAVEQAMIASALRGVRVMLMTVGRPDKRIPFWASQTYFGHLLEAGVEIYRYEAGFLHSKVMIQDRMIASIGTCNLDLRSFLLDYEVNAVLYSPIHAKIHAERFIKDLDYCRRITKEDIENLPQPARLRNAAVRLLSPLI
ncbi:MAG: cardiolipin synthase [Spirochaetaceae bacterium]|nr:cardiolipin synthase [Spirochaetaceae bacterium]